MKTRKILYPSFREWFDDVVLARKITCWAIYLCINSIVSAIASIIYYVWSAIRDFSKREPVAFFIVFIIIATMSYGWAITFIQMQGKIVRTQDMLDSISYKTSIRLAR